MKWKLGLHRGYIGDIVGIAEIDGKARKGHVLCKGVKLQLSSNLHMTIWDTCSITCRAESSMR